MGSEFDAGWRTIRPLVAARVQLGRAATVHAAYQYTSSVLAETGQSAPGSGVLEVGAFVEAAPVGVPVAVALDGVPVRAKQAVAAGASVGAARRVAQDWATQTVLTMLADTRRDVYQADMIQRPTITGYVRMLNMPSCKRCIILAGKWFRWNEGFQRHPKCDCVHIPASEQVAGDLTTDPYEAFRSLSEAEQDATFGRSNARAIRDGADIYRVVNASQLPTSSSRIDRIYRTAGTRSNAIRMLTEQKFILPRGQVAVARGRGVLTDAEALAIGRGQGSFRIGTNVGTTSRAARYDAALSGARDPLNRSTMTAAEKRLYDANYRVMWARQGYYPNTVGVNTADRGLGLRPIRPEEALAAEERLRAEIATAYAEGSPDQVRNLARLLGH